MESLEDKVISFLEDVVSEEVFHCLDKHYSSADWDDFYDCPSIPKEITKYEGDKELEAKILKMALDKFPSDKEKVKEVVLANIEEYGQKAIESYNYDKAG